MFSRGIAEFRQFPNRATESLAGKSTVEGHANTYAGKHHELVAQRSGVKAQSLPDSTYPPPPSPKLVNRFIQNYCGPHLEILKSSGVQSVKLPPCSPNLNTPRLRFIRRTIPRGVLDGASELDS
jgi:hypothetical protein